MTVNTKGHSSIDPAPFSLTYVGNLSSGTNLSIATTGSSAAVNTMTGTSIMITQLSDI